MAKVLMKGNEAIGEAAIRAGCLNYFAYPITPQSEVAEYLARRMPEVGGMFLQGESEVAVGYMIFGAAAAGERVFTTSSSPGISLMGESISYIASAECPAVFVKRYDMNSTGFFLKSMCSSLMCAMTASLPSCTNPSRRNSR